jgi:hypothetical protein
MSSPHPAEHALAPASPVHVLRGASSKADRLEALRGLHLGLAQAEQNLHGLLATQHFRGHRPAAVGDGASGT